MLVNPICTSAKVFYDHWIVDSGATDHITCSFDKLSHPIPIDASIHLPNGEVSFITHKGTVQLTPTLTLHNVLYVPNFKFNLISISKLTSESHCCAFFLPNVCVFCAENIERDW